MSRVCPASIGKSNGSGRPFIRENNVHIRPVLSDSSLTMNSTLSPTAKVRRKPSARRRAGSHVPPYQTQETHDAALNAIRSFLRGRTSYDAFPVSFRLIVLDTKLNVKKALQCLLLNGGTSKYALQPHPHVS
jgi:hypothetical protein